VIVPQVWHPVITLEGTLLLKTDLAGGALGVLGLDPIHQRRLPGGGLFQRRLVAGRFFAEGEHDAAVLSVAAARNLKLELGSALRLPGLDALRVVGLFDGGSRLFDLVVVVDINQARRLKQIDTGRVSSFFVEVADPRRAEALAARIDRDYPALRAFTPDALGALAGDLLSKLDKILLVITILPLLGAAAAVANTMMMSFSERIAEFGVLMACGWRRADVLQLVIAEASLLGLAGGLVGALLGALATAGLASYLAVEPVTPWWLHGACILLAVMLGAAGGLYPAWRAARLSPMEAIRHHG
jgi:putative ABC transport system permease protein